MQVLCDLSKMILVGVFGLSVLACNQGFQTSDRVNQVVQQNYQASDYSHWSLSNNRPEVVFEVLNTEVEQGRSPDEVSIELCRSLGGLSGQSLQIFESQIYDTQNHNILKHCHNLLKDKIDQFHLQNRSTFKQEGFRVLGDSDQRKLNFKTMEVDYSKGPRLIDGGLPDKHVVLTFDDGPNPVTTPMITDALEAAGVRAHFFMVGQVVKRHVQVAKRIAQSGHSIGNHTVSHPCLGSSNACNGIRRLDFAKGRGEIITAHQMLDDLIGIVDPIFRFPYGASTPELRQFLQDNQTSDFFWNIDSLDWKANQSHRDVLNRTMQQVERERKGIILFHDIHRRTAEILPELLARLDRGGYTVVLLTPLDEKLRRNHPFLQNANKP